MTPSAETGLTTMLVIVGGLGLLIGIAVYVWYALALSRLFPRIDGEGWKGWVPVLNEAEILARGGVPAWSVVFYFIPLVQLYGLYLKIVATHRINRRFGRGAGMTVLAILLPPVWATVLAWGAPPYPEGERLAALQPGPRRTAQPAAAPARDASGYTIPSLAPHSPTSTGAPALIFPDYAAPARTPADVPAPAAQAAQSAQAAQAAPADAGAYVPAGQTPAAQAPAAPASSPWGAPPQPPTTFGAPPAPGAPAASFAPPASVAPSPPVAPAAPAAPTPTGVAAAPPAFAAQPPAAPAPPAPQPSASPAAPPSPPARVVPPAVETADAHPVTGIMATMGAAPVDRAAPADDASLVGDVAPAAAAATAAVAPPAVSVRPAPPSFRSDGAQGEPVAPVIRPAPASPAAPASAAAPASPAAPTSAAAPAAPVIMPAPGDDASVPAAEAPAPVVPAPVVPAPLAPPASVPLGGLTPDVDKTVVSPRPTDEDLEATVVVARRRGVRRSLVLDDGRTFALSGASVVIGRNPTGEAGEQRLAISDTTRTLSKTHARLVVHEDEWRLTDLHATNGVVVVGDDGTETLLDPGESVVGNGRFILGEVGMHVIAERDS